jgi:hypothetical protein
MATAPPKQPETLHEAYQAQEAEKTDGLSKPGDLYQAHEKQEANKAAGTDSIKKHGENRTYEMPGPDGRVMRQVIAQEQYSKDRGKPGPKHVEKYFDEANEKDINSEDLDNEQDRGR